MSNDGTAARINIDLELCTGCGTCVDSCCLDVIRLDEKAEKAMVKFPEDCMLCAYCELDCPEDAILVSPVKHGAITLSWG